MTPLADVLTYAGAFVLAWMFVREYCSLSSPD